MNVLQNRNNRGAEVGQPNVENILVTVEFDELKPKGAAKSKYIYIYIFKFMGICFVRGFAIYASYAPHTYLVRSRGKFLRPDHNFAVGVRLPEHPRSRL